MSKHQFVIIGPPGSGKSTLLQHVALTLVAGRHQRRKSKAPPKLPILLFLRNHAEIIEADPDISLAILVQNYLSKKWQQQVPPRWFEGQLAAGNCLVMLDGLDEVADPKLRRGVVKWVEQQMKIYGKNRFIVTSRPFGYQGNPLAGVTVLEVASFTTEQIHQYIYNWYLANEVMSAQKKDRGVQMKAREGADDLLRRLHNTPALLAFAVNPLLLTMIATIHRYRNRLPGRRIELYAEICDVFLGKRQEAKNIPQDLTAAQKQTVLQKLAYHMMSIEKREIGLADALAVIKEPLERVSTQISGTAFLQMIQDSSGLLLERENEVYSFSHLTFQEFMAAKYIGEKNLESELVKNVDSTWWHEVIRLYSAQADATSIVLACLRVKNTRSPAGLGQPYFSLSSKAAMLPSLPALTLAIECLEEAREVAPEARTQLDVTLDQGIEAPSQEHRRIVAEAQLSKRLQKMINFSEGMYIDTSLLTCAEFQLFLNAQSQGAISYQPDHWSDEQFRQGQGKSPILGVRPAHAESFCKWLTEHKADEWSYRLPLVGELNQAMTLKMKIDTGYWAKAAQGFQFVTVGYSSTAIKFASLHEQVNSDQERARVLHAALMRGPAPPVPAGLTIEHARNLSRTLAAEYDSGIKQTRTFAASVGIDLSREFGGEHSDYLDPRLGRVLTFAENFNLSRALDFSSGLDHACALAGTTSLGKALKLYRTGKRLENDQLDFLRWFIRISALSMIFAHWRKQSAGQNDATQISRFFQRIRQDSEDVNQQMIDSFIDIFIGFVNLEVRRKGSLAPFEGILLVKERKV